MTSTPSETRPFRIAELSTLVALPWSDEAPERTLKAAAHVVLPALSLHG
ncbi:DUF5949 family protein [Streptomyces sp. R41]|uniref:DUF5949 family protein n=1 Tax=Streptomyces sp. R41 TaxID=3238632 RepID=A0AB39RIB4_9ACTN